MTESPDQNQRPCPLCGAFDRQPIFQRDVWHMVKCTRCEMVFIGDKPLPYDAQAADHDWVDDYSKEVSRRKSDRPVLMFFSRLTLPLRRDATDRQLSHTLHWKREGKLLDLGCGDGRFLAKATSYFDVMGVELSARAVESAKALVPDSEIVVSPVTEAVVPESEFDVVTQFGYIEHEWQPVAGLNVAFRAIKPGGILVIKTPNYASWNRFVMGEDWCGIHIPAHCNYFTPTTLGQMLRQVGFEPLPQPLFDRLPTSDTLWLTARKP